MPWRRWLGRQCAVHARAEVAFGLVVQGKSVLSRQTAANGRFAFSVIAPKLFSHAAEGGCRFDGASEKALIYLGGTDFSECRDQPGFHFSRAWFASEHDQARTCVRHGW
jgi:hypothetical protein